jgi:endonuclease YncB( thermonuclease family)
MSPARYASLLLCLVRIKWTGDCLVITTPTTTTVEVCDVSRILVPFLAPASSPFVNGPWLLAVTSPKNDEAPDQFGCFQKDVVVRVIDANHVKLKKAGLVSLAGIKGSSSNFVYPECFRYDPAYKLQQLLPNQTPVKLKMTSLSQAVLVSDGRTVVNQELVRAGFARVKTATELDPSVLDVEELLRLQEEAKEKGLGIFQRCDEKVTTTAPVSDFEPVDYAIGRLVVKPTSELSSTPTKPKNPGDTKGCSDFSTYEDALRWYERYKPWYGDVAKLDRDGDGVPCPGLPHTKSPEMYRTKVPQR